jgi:hypothetical protein
MRLQRYFGVNFMTPVEVVQYTLVASTAMPPRIGSFDARIVGCSQPHFAHWRTSPSGVKGPGLVVSALTQYTFVASTAIACPPFAPVTRTTGRSSAVVPHVAAPLLAPVPHPESAASTTTTRG